jgi:hypothetical protein
MKLMPISRLLSLLLPSILLSTAALAQSLPETGQLDAGKVVQARYGAAPAALAAPGQAAPDWGDGITGVVVEAKEAAGKTALPLSFGQAFAQGDLKPGDTLVGRLGDGATLPLQVDVKATHPDGSVRHAVISALLPAPGKTGAQALALVKDKTKAGAKAGAHASVQALLDAGFTASASATIDGQAWTASADKLLRQKPELWLDGPLVTEWLVSAPLKNDKGLEHPRLSARFAVRWYHALNKARVDVTLENTWAYQPTPQNYTYDARVLVGGKEVFAKPRLTHLNQARWRKVVWWGEVPDMHIRHDTAYLIASRALPNYDQSVRASGAALSSLGASWTGARTEPMGVGLALAYMPTSGGRTDIGLLPAWSVLYLLSMDPTAKTATLGTADLAGSWSVHYRDQHTGRPVSLIDYPYIARLGTPNDTTNPKTGKPELLPACAKDACTTPYTEDLAHQPSFAYLPYLVTGDFYYLEELEFWAMFDALAGFPPYRENIKGLVKPQQVRGQAWALRTMGEAAWIAPDADRLKAHFKRVVKSNLDWFNENFTDNPRANKLGFTGEDQAGYQQGTAIAPWQDDFLTSAIGRLAEFGFPEASRLLAWKAAFPIGRMIAPGACWIDGAMYSMVVRDGPTSPFYTSMAQAFKASRPAAVAALPCAGSEMAQALKLKPGEMSGDAASPMGTPAIMQPALAYAADTGSEAGKQAWALFIRRGIKPDYSGAPEFAIVPRQAAAPKK